MWMNFHHVIAAEWSCKIPIRCRGIVPASKSGTLVRLRKCDRLDNRDTEVLTRRLRSEFGRLFREFLFRGTKITIGRSRVRPSDPLFLRKGTNPLGASLYGPPLLYQMKSRFGEATIMVRFSELPVSEWYALSNKEESSWASPNVLGFPFSGGTARSIMAGIS